MVKKIPLIGIDDGGFQLFNPQWRSVHVFGVIMRGHHYTEKIVKTTILKDDPDPTSKIIAMIRRSGHLQNLKAILHKGITIGGFGVIDPTRIVDELHLPFVAILTREPDFNAIRNALANLDDGDDRWKTITKHGNPMKIKDGLWIQVSGCDSDMAREWVLHSTVVGHVPEPLRLAHMIGKAIYEEDLLADLSLEVS